MSQNRVSLSKDMIRYIVLNHIVPRNRKGAWGIVAIFRLLSKQFRDIFTIRDLKDALSSDKKFVKPYCTGSHVPVGMYKNIPHFSTCFHCSKPSCRSPDTFSVLDHWPTVCESMRFIANAGYPQDEGGIWAWYAMPNAYHIYFRYGRARVSKRIKL